MNAITNTASLLKKQTHTLQQRHQFMVNSFITENLPQQNDIWKYITMK